MPDISRGRLLAVRGEAPLVSLDDWPLLTALVVLGVVLLVLRGQHIAFWKRVLGGKPYGPLYDVIVFGGIPIFLIALGLVGFVSALAR